MGAWPSTARDEPSISSARRPAPRRRAHRLPMRCTTNPSNQDLPTQVYRFMTLKSAIAAILQQEDLNFLLTNRIPRRLLTRFIGWGGRMRTPPVGHVSGANSRVFF